MQNSNPPVPHKRPEIVRILIYVGIIWATGFVTSALQGLLMTVVSQLRFLHSFLSIVSILLSVIFTICSSVVIALLARQFVFRSKANPTMPVVVLCVLNVIRTLAVTGISSVLIVFLDQGAITDAQYVLFINAISLLLTWGVHALGYLIQRLSFYAKTLDTL